MEFGPHELVKKTEFNRVEALGFQERFLLQRKGQTPVEGLLEGAFNNSFMDYKRYPLWSIGTKQGRLSESTFKFTLNY